MHQVSFPETGEQLACTDKQSLLQSMERLGYRGIPVGCRNGGCGVCKVHVMEGQVDRRAMSRAHVSPDEEAQGIGLACRLTPRSNLTVRVISKMRRAFENIHHGKGI